MGTFLFQTAIQGAVIALLWVFVSRDATKLRAEHGSPPSGISPFAWGALCGLTWIALIPYFGRRSKPAPAGPERNLLTWWLVLAAVAIIWSGYNAAQDDANNAAQHAILAAVFLVCALIARSRDSSSAASASSTTTAGVAVGTERE